MLARHPIPAAVLLAALSLRLRPNAGQFLRHAAARGGQALKACSIVWVPAIGP
jgi:hypothetical protein